MRVVFSFAGGVEAPPKGEPVYMELLRDRDTPADGLELHFAGRDGVFSQTPLGVRLEKDGVPQFEGIVDEVRLEKKDGGETVRYLCRSRAALLLDNEAMPGEMQMPSVRSVTRRFLEPLGLTGEGDDLLPKKGRMIVERGTRCWEAVCGFSEEFLRVTPYCTLQGTVCFKEKQPVQRDLPPVKRITVTRRPMEKISRVVVQNARTGAYGAVYENPVAEGTERVRYLSAKADTSPKALFEEGEQKALQAVVVVFGFCGAEPGDRFDLSAYGADMAETELTALRYICTADREETVLMLTAVKKEEM